MHWPIPAIQNRSSIKLCHFSEIVADSILLSVARLLCFKEMERTGLDVVVGDATGATWGALLFLVFSLGLGYATYGVMQRLACMGSLDRRHQAGRGIGMVLGAAISLGAFAAFYVSSLSGFYDVQLRGDQVILHYLFPDRYVTYSAVNLLKVETEPAFKSRWRLVVHDVDGAVFQSTLSDQQDVQRAWNLLHPVIDAEPLARP